MIKRSLFLGLFCIFSAAFLPHNVSAQVDQICGESTGTVWLDTFVVYGKVTVNGLDSTAKFPKITVTLNSRGRDTASYTVDRSGYFCFRGSDGSGGILTVEVEGLEVGRQVLPSGVNLRQFRQDFEVIAPSAQGLARPAAISVKMQYPRSEENTKLLGEAAAAAQEGKADRAIKLLKQVVASDPADFIAWSQLGAAYFEKQQYEEADAAYKAALKAKPDLAPAMMNVGRIHLVSGRIQPAIESLTSATQSDPTLARAFQLLGEAYLLDKKGTLGVQALNEAIRLDPKGMAESHLLLATLYDRAGAKFMASREYKMFLQKVPDHKDAKKFRRYIEENPDTGQ